jgi:arylsulfatase A
VSNSARVAVICAALLLLSSVNGPAATQSVPPSVVVMTHNTPFRAGKGYLYEGGLRVPLLVQGPGLARRRVIDWPFLNTDWVPTLLELAGVSPASNLDGVSQARLLRTGTAAAGTRRCFWHLPHYTNQGSRPAGAIRDGRWKLVEHYDTDSVELFDLEADIGETKDRSKQQPARTDTMRQLLRQWRRSVSAQENAANPSFDANLYRQLYVDFDPTRFDPLAADDHTWKTVASWRERMNAAIKPAAR